MSHHWLRAPLIGRARLSDAVGKNFFKQGRWRTNVVACCKHDLPDRRLQEVSSDLRPALVPALVSCVLTAWLAPAQPVAYAAEFDGVAIPDTMQVYGKTLHLNGYGLRTYSFLGIHIYVASLYLEHLSTNPDEIIRSAETKLLTVRFKHNVAYDEAREAWREGLANNCVAPCHLDPNDVKTFLALVPAMYIGDNYALLFHEHRVIVTVGERLVGTVSSPEFAQAMLAVFLGPKPALPMLKHDLLAGHGS